MAQQHSALTGANLHNPKGIGVETHSTSSLIISQSAGGHVGAVTASANIVPSSTNTYSLGNANLIWKEIFVSTGSIKFMDNGGNVVQAITADSNGINMGTGRISGSATSTGSFGRLEVIGNGNIDGNLTLGGNITIGDADSDSIAINADFTSNLIPNTDNNVDIGSASKQWKDLYVNGIGYIDQLGTDADPVAVFVSSGELDGVTLGGESQVTITDADMNGGTIDGVTIGVSSATTGNFTNVTGSVVSASTAIFTNLSGSSANIDGGTIDSITSLTAAGNLDIGAHDLRAATITADGLTSGRVVFAGTNGVLSDDSDMSFSGDT
jgi:hypothetical protein